MTDKRRQLEEAIASLEAQRAVLGDAVVDTAVGPLRQELAALDSDDRATRRRQVTVLFADVSGFTEMSEDLDPEVVQSRMNRVWSSLDGLIESHGGHIDKHIGDAVMAIFGLPSPREDDPVRAVRAALQMQAAMPELGADREGEPGDHALALRIGLNTGLVLLGEVGSTSEFTAMGDTVNLASRLESSAPVGGVLVAEATWRQVRGLFDGEAVPPLRVKGKAKPVQAVRVLAERGIGRRRERGVDVPSRPFVGREQELAAAVEALRAGLATGRPSTVILSGEPGVGKTRLAEELIEGLSADADSGPAAPRLALPVITVRGEHSGRDVPYSAIQSLAHGAEGMPGAERTQSALARLSTGSEAVDADGARDALIQAVAVVLAGETPESGAVASGADGVAPEGPDRDQAPGSVPAQGRDGAGLLLYLDDWQWLDRSSVEVLTEALDRTRDTALAVLVTSRPDGAPSAKSGLPNPTSMPLEPLTRDAARALVGALLPDLAASAVDALADRSAGNPFFLEEIVHSLIARGRLSASDAARRTSHSHDGDSVASSRAGDADLNDTVLDDTVLDDEIPASLTGVIQARLETLSSDARRLLEAAAVFGDPFWDRALADLSAAGTKPSPDLAALEELLNEGIAMRRAESQFSDATEFEFRHTLFREVTYEHVLLEDRRRVHAAAGQWLANLSGPGAGKLAGRVADHLEAGRLEKDAAHWHRLAGDYADGIYANREALARYRRAEALIEADPDGSHRDELLAVLSGIERVLDRLGDREAQQGAVEALRAQAL